MPKFCKWFVNYFRSVENVTFKSGRERGVSGLWSLEKGVTALVQIMRGSSDCDQPKLKLETRETQVWSIGIYPYVGTFLWFEAKLDEKSLSLYVLYLCPVFTYIWHHRYSNISIKMPIIESLASYQRGHTKLFLSNLVNILYIHIGCSINNPFVYDK
jgi:hypothetical protein